MEVSNQEVNSEGDQTNPVSGIVRYVIDYPDDAIETDNKDGDSKVHQTQLVAGIAGDAAQSFAPIIRQTNSNSGKLLCLEIYDIYNNLNKTMAV